MRIVVRITVVMLAATLCIFGKTERAEQDVKSFLAQYEQAIVKRDVAFIERILADDYTYLSSNGSEKTEIRRWIIGNSSEINRLTG